MRLVLAIAALAAFLVAMFGSAQAPAAMPAPAATTPAPGGTAHTPSDPSLAAPPAAPSSTPALAGANALHAVESSVQAARQRGAGDNEIHQLRASRLTAAQLEALISMEAAEASWQRRVTELRERCGTRETCGASLAPEERARWRSYAEAALRQ